MTEDEAAAVGLADLDRIFPDVQPSQLVQDHRRIDWCTNRFTRGGYSFVRVGGAGSRAALAAPDTGALFWAATPPRPPPSPRSCTPPTPAAAAPPARSRLTSAR